MTVTGNPSNHLPLIPDIPTPCPLPTREGVHSGSPPRVGEGAGGGVSRENVYTLFSCVMAGDPMIVLTRGQKRHVYRAI